MGAKRLNTSLRAPLPVTDTPRQRLLSHLRRAREEAVALAFDSEHNMFEVVSSIDYTVREVKDAIPE